MNKHSMSAETEIASLRRELSRESSRSFYWEKAYVQEQRSKVKFAALAFVLAITLVVVLVLV